MELWVTWAGLETRRRSTWRGETRDSDTCLGRGPRRAEAREIRSRKAGRRYLSQNSDLTDPCWILIPTSWRCLATSDSVSETRSRRSRSWSWLRRLSPPTPPLSEDDDLQLKRSGLKHKSIIFHSLTFWISSIIFVDETDSVWSLCCQYQKWWIER